MTRTVPEWIGKTDDQPFPPRVRLRILLRFNGHCAGCGRKIAAGETWTADHVVALVNGGQNRESNGQPLCQSCNKTKNASDVADKAKVARMAKAAYGLKKPKRAMPGSKASGWRKRMDGRVERRTK